MHTSAGILKKLKVRGSRRNIEGMARFGITTERRPGVSVPEMRRIAGEYGTDHALSIRLWNSGIPEARIVASMIADPAKLTAVEMDRWASEFDSWDVCDQVCMNLFEKTPFARRKIREWARRDEEYVRRGV